jgi:hypothetical protein
LKASCVSVLRQSARLRLTLTAMWLYGHLGDSGVEA